MIFEVKVKYGYDQKTKSYTAEIPELNYVSSFGDTFEECEKNIKEAVLAYLESNLIEKLVSVNQNDAEGTFIRLDLPNELIVQNNV